MHEINIGDLIVCNLPIHLESIIGWTLRDCFPIYRGDIGIATYTNRDMLNLEVFVNGSLAQTGIEFWSKL